MVIFNRAGHVIYSEFILILGMGGYLLYLLRNDTGIQGISVAIIFSICTYLLGCIAPDFDHHRVHKIKWFAKISKHRGHFHSFGAMCIYGGLLFLVFYWLLVDYWWMPVNLGMFGFFTHILLDEIKNIRTNGSRTLKLW